MFVIDVKFGNIVRYIHDIFLIRHAEPDQVCYFVRYNRVFIITVIVITEFDCSSFEHKTWKAGRHF
jgi:hypothetical protein